MAGRPSALGAAGRELLTRLVTVPPRQAKLTVGVDLGTTSVKLLALGPRKGGERQVLARELASVDPSREGDAVRALQAAAAALPTPARRINISVGGQGVIIRIIEMPTMKPAEIRQALPFEAQRYLPFQLEDVLIDGAMLGPASPNRIWVLIVACKKDLIERRLAVVRQAGCEAALIDVDALAVTNAFLASLNGRGAEQRRALLNVGAQATSLVILRDTIPYLIRDIPWGGEKLLRDLSAQTHCDVETLMPSLIQRTAGGELAQALKIASEALVTELQLSFDYFENHFGQPPEEILVSGGLSQAPPFVDALKAHLAQAVTVWEPARGIPGQFAVAYGLALRAPGEG